MSVLPQRILETAIGPMDELKRMLTEQVEKAEEFARKGRELLRTMSSDRPDRPSLVPDRYSKLPPYPAMVVMFREHKRAMSEQEIVEELVDGKVMTGAREQTAKTRTENVKRAIKANVNNGNLRCVKVGEVEKYGPSEWDDSYFQ